MITENVRKETFWWQRKISITWRETVQNIIVQQSNNKIYFLKLASKRRIEVKKIKAITVGTLGTEFVVHVPEEYDYRYSSAERYKNKKK